MKTCIIIIFLSTFFFSCSPRVISVEKSKFRYLQVNSIHGLEINIEIYANDSIKINTNKGGYNRACIGLIKRIEHNTYKVLCYDYRGNSEAKLSDFIPSKMNVENDTLFLS